MMELDARSRDTNMSKSKNSPAKLGGMNNFVYDSVLWALSVMIDTFFREIHPRSSWRIPKQGPVIFVAAPHANQFIDPLILMQQIRTEAKRRVSFLIAEKSMKRRFIGFGASLVGALPVGRALDNQQSVPGKIYLPDPENDPTLIRGVGTNFESKDFQVGGLVVLPSVNHKADSSEIVAIIGPEELRIKKPFSGTTAINQLTGRARVVADGETEADVPQQFEGTAFKVAPKIDQKVVYDAVFERLKQGGCVGIFPEGGSHDRTELLPIKAGVAIMVLGTLSASPDCDLAVVPCGMNYFNAHKFRSRCVVEFGTPIEIKKEYVELYKNGERREAVGKLLSEIHDALVGVTINSPDYETLMLIQAIRRLYRPKHRKLSMPEVVVLHRRIAQGYGKYKDNPAIQALKENVMRYNRELRRLGLRDHQVEYARFPWYKVLWLLCKRVTSLIGPAILAFPGALLFSPVFVLGKFISHQKSKEALAASTVKIQANDVIATWKLLVAMAVAPIVCTFYNAILAIIFYSYKHDYWFLSKVPTVLVFLLGYVLFPCTCLMALKYGETGMDILKSLPPLFKALNPEKAQTMAHLRSRRMELAQEVSRVINDLGPDMFPDFEKIRIIPNDDRTAIIEDEEKEAAPIIVRSDSDGDIHSSAPSSPTSPLYGRRSGHLPRNESLHNISNIGIFASHPATPYHVMSRSRSQSASQSRNQSRSQSRSRSTSSGSAGGMGLQGFSPLESRDSMDELSKKIKETMKKRNVRRGSESGSSTPASDMDGLIMTRANKKDE